jgi:hypothetical protein
MSETNSAPPPSGDASVTPATPVTPASQPELSISDAARMLRNQRRAQASQATPGIGHNSGEAPPSVSRETPPAAPQPSGEPRGMAALEAALGLPPGEAGAPQPPPVPEAGLEIDGRRWSQAEIQAELSKARDYTQKTQQVAQQARELQAQQQALAAFLPLIQPELTALQQRLADSPRPDPALRFQDPASYWDQFAAWQDSLAEQQRVQQLINTQAQARDAAMQQAVEQANRELAQKYSFWADPAQRREIQTKIIDWARTQGYTDQELQGLTNARYLETLFKAALYDQGVRGATTRAPTQSIQPAQVRGTAPPPSQPAAVAAAMEAFGAKPDVRNAAALIGARRAGRPNGQANW